MHRTYFNENISSFHQIHSLVVQYETSHGIYSRGRKHARIFFRSSDDKRNLKRDRHSLRDAEAIHFYFGVFFSRENAVQCVTDMFSVMANKFRTICCRAWRVCGAAEVTIKIAFYVRMQDGRSERIKNNGHFDCPGRNEIYNILKLNKWRSVVHRIELHWRQFHWADNCEENHRNQCNVARESIFSLSFFANQFFFSFQLETMSVR